MTDARVEWRLHTPAGSLPLEDGSTWGLDTGWSPRGAGTVRVRLDAWDALGLAGAEDDTMHLLLECRSTPYAESATLALKFTSGGPGGWPVAPARRYDPKRSDLLPASSRRWHVYVSEAERDLVAGTLLLAVTTFELLVVETLNLAADWWPVPTSAGRYDLAHVALQLFRYIGVPAAAPWSTARTLTADQMEPWAAGTSAWDWLERLRAKGGFSVRTNPERDSLTYGPTAPIADGTVPAHYPLAESAVRLGGVGESDGLAYADAVRVTWEWTDDAGEPATEVEVVLAPGITDWRKVRKVAELTLPGRRIPGHARLIVTELHRWRSVAFFAWPLTWPVPDLGAGEAERWRSLRFAIDTTTVATASVILTT